MQPPEQILNSMLIHTICAHVISWKLIFHGKHHFLTLPTDTCSELSCCRPTRGRIQDLKNEGAQVAWRRVFRHI